MFEPKPARDDSHDPPKKPWALSEADREFLRVNRIDPEDAITPRETLSPAEDTD